MAEGTLQLKNWTSNPSMLSHMVGLQVKSPRRVQAMGLAGFEWAKLPTLAHRH